MLVQKFGGTSVADPDRIRAVAEHIVRTRRAGDDVVVVVSAMKVIVRAPSVNDAGKVRRGAWRPYGPTLARRIRDAKGRQHPVASRLRRLLADAEVIGGGCRGRGFLRPTTTTSCAAHAFPGGRGELARWFW